MIIICVIKSLKCHKFSTHLVPNSKRNCTPLAEPHRDLLEDIWKKTLFQPNEENFRDGCLQENLENDNVINSTYFTGLADQIMSRF